MSDDRLRAIKKGDRVEVLDDGLAALRAILPDAPPNNRGVVDEVRDGLVYIIFDGPDGLGTSNCAPYAIEDVRRYERWWVIAEVRVCPCVARKCR